MGAVAAAIGDIAQLLDVHMEQVARRVAFVAADRATGGPVQVGQASQAVADQHAVHRGWVEAQQVGDVGRTPPAGQADLDDASGQANPMDVCLSGSSPST